MFTDAELSMYRAGCLTAQPDIELGHPEIDLFAAMANPPAEVYPPWIPGISTFTHEES